VHRILDEINADAIVSLAKELIAIPTPVTSTGEGQEIEAANALARRLQSSGFNVELQEVMENRPNLIATLKGKGGGRSLMLNGHLDTVEAENMVVPPFEGKVDGGKLLGRGAVDMKGALAAFVVAGEAIERLGVELKGDLTISGCVDEEGKGIGGQAMAKSLQGVDAAIVGEATGMKIGVAHKGLTFITLHTYGKATHGSTPHLGVNAITGMVKVLNTIDSELPRRLEAKRHKALGPPTYNVGVIRGGYRPNVVPDRCEIEVDRRMVPGETVESVLGEMESILDVARSGDVSLKVDAQALDWAKAVPMEISGDEQIVRSIVKCLQASGRQAEVSTVPYWTDASSFVNLAGIPTVVFGPGDISQAHSSTESIDIEELLAYSKLIASVALDFCNSDTEKT
jgi:acetylornithine deacetylase/succinyl-diaminopimelate desuccinylase